VIRRETLGTATTPDGGEIVLTRDAVGFVISADDRVLMSSVKHGSERAMAEVACPPLGALTRPRVLVAGLGLGYTLRATLDRLPPTADVVCIELMDAIVQWHRGPLGLVADHPIDDPRVTMVTGDVTELIKETSPAEAFDAVLLDVDNGPIPMTVVGNWWLYAAAGLAGLHRAIRPGGMLVVWSVEEDDLFVGRMEAAGFATDVVRVAERSGRRVSGRCRRAYVLFVGRR
jgi:spermidine synthase